MPYEVEKAGSAGKSKGRKSGPRIDAQAGARNFGRYTRLLETGHLDYVVSAERCERMYVGSDGSRDQYLQWEPDEAKRIIDAGGRPVEENKIRSIVNAAVGYQIANRMDPQLLPRGRGADDKTAALLTKVLKQVLDNNQYHWRETEAFADGLIRKRGWLDIRMAFDDHALGEVRIYNCDPADEMPDNMAQSYNPEDDWRDITTSRWLTLDDIEFNYGKKARDLVESVEALGQDFFSDQLQMYKKRFGNDQGQWQPQRFDDEQGDVYLHVIDRQYTVYEPTLCAIYPTGDIRPIPEPTPERIEAFKAHGAIIEKRSIRRRRWLVTSMNVVLFDDFSPYGKYSTKVPFFPYFRHGITRGIVDQAIGPQQSLNRSLTELHQIISSVAHSGYAVEENSLAGMSFEQFKQKASSTGFSFEYKQGAKKPERIEPPQLPSGVIEVITQSTNSLDRLLGETVTGDAKVDNDMSGVAYQARQYAAQQRLATPLDNLARTRHMVVERVLYCIQHFYDAPRIMRITETDPLTGTQISTELAVNQPNGDGTYWNDLTIGEYDIVIAEQPMQITFDNSQFAQVERLIAMGYPIPPHVALRYSNLAEKAEIAQAVEQASQQQPDPLNDARAELARAQAERQKVETMNKRIEAVYGATQAGAQIGAMPAIASIADEILQSAGFDDQNAAPIIPQGAIGAGIAQVAPPEPVVDPAAAEAPASTNPMTPANPGVGFNEGIEEPGVQ